MVNGRTWELIEEHTTEILDRFLPPGLGGQRSEWGTVDSSMWTEGPYVWEGGPDGGDGLIVWKRMTVDESMAAGLRARWYPESTEEPSFTPGEWEGSPTVSWSTLWTPFGSEEDHWRSQKRQLSGPGGWTTGPKSWEVIPKRLYAGARSLASPIGRKDIAWMRVDDPTGGKYDLRDKYFVKPIDNVGYFQDFSYIWAYLPLNELEPKEQYGHHYLDLSGRSERLETVYDKGSTGEVRGNRWKVMGKLEPERYFQSPEVLGESSPREHMFFDIAALAMGGEGGELLPLVEYVTAMSNGATTGRELYWSEYQGGWVRQGPRGRVTPAPRKPTETSPLPSGNYIWSAEKGGWITRP